MSNSIFKTLEPSFTQLSEVASEGSGGQIVFATDDFFAPAEMMIQDSEPVFITDKYTSYGKWMDGWETRRKRIPGHDWCIIKLAAPALIRGFTVDTAFFTGNFAPRVSIQGCLMRAEDEKLFPKRKSEMGTACLEQDLIAMQKLQSNKWNELVPMTEMQPGYEDSRINYLLAYNPQLCTHIRLNIYPDGGIARFRVFGDVQQNIDDLFEADAVDLIGLLNGGICQSYSNAHYGHPRNLIKPSKGVNMGDGWETARRLDRPPILETDIRGILQLPGCEWAIFKLCYQGVIERIVVDTNHFKGNFPDSCKIEGAYLRDGDTLASGKWFTILNSSKLSANREHEFNYEDIIDYTPCTHVRITMAPDGGISRVRLFGRLVR